MSTVLLVSLGIAVLWPSPSAGLEADQTVRPGITWSAPSVCPAPAEVERSLREAIGDSEPEQLRGTASVSANSASQWQLDISIVADGSQSARVLRANDCQTLADAYVLLLSVAIGRSPDPVQPPAFAPTRTGPGAEVGLSGLLEVGALPRWTGGGRVHGAVTGHGWLAGLAVSYVAPRRVAVAPDATLTLQRYEVAAFGGPVLRRRWGSLALMAGLGAGGVLARSRGPVTLGQPHAPWLAAHSSARVGVKITDRLSALLALTGLAAITRVRYRHNPSGRPLAQTNRWGGRATLGLSYDFGPRR